MKISLIKLLTFFANLGTKLGLHKIYFFQFIYGKLMSVFGNKEDLELIKTNYGFYMYISKLGLVLEKTIKNTGIWEKEITELIESNLKEGDIFIDIGANIGWDSMIAANKIGKEGKIIAFEPSKYNFNVFRKNILYNQIDNIDLRKKGIGSKKIEDTIYYVPNNPGNTSILKNNNNKFLQKETISINTLDDELKNNNKIDLIKIDVEGYEYEVFLGMQDIIKKHHPKIILELTPDTYNKKYNDKNFTHKFIKEIINLGYSIYHINEFSLTGATYKSSLLESIKENDIDIYLKKIKQSNLLIK